VKEINDITRSFDEAQKLGKQTALATVVHVDGSSYRRPGARMLITEDGELTGAISGGCLEGDALRKALLVMTEKRAMLVTYDTMDEDDAKFGVGLGCNGIIQVLIEPVDPADEHNPIQFLKAIAARRQPAALVTLFSLQNRKETQPGTCLLLINDINTGHSPLPGDVLIQDAKEALTLQQSSFKNYISDTQNLTAFIEIIRPAVSLVIAGAGNDAIPLVALANILGWETTVVDGRANYAKRERFPAATRVLVSKPEQVLQQVSIDAQTVFVLVTHNYNYDMALLQQLIERKVSYAGMLGPRKKWERMLGEWKEQGIHFSAEQLSIIHTPVGLNIGAETAEEIALSIVAEIQAVLAGREGQSLKDSDVIHARNTTVIQEKKLV
jgi:xanthine dehydrogenase accessory factor